MSTLAANQPVPNDNPGSLFNIESFDPASKVFVGTHPGRKERYLGAIWEGEPLSGIGEGELLAIQASLSSFFPVGTIIQFGLLATPDIQGAIYDYESGKAKVNSGPILKELVNRHSQLMLSGAKTPIIKSSGVHFCKKRLIVSIKIPVDSVNGLHIKEFSEYVEKLQSGLSAGGLRLHRMNVQEYLRTCRLITHIYDNLDNRYDETVPLCDQVFYGGDEVVVHKDHLEFNTGNTSENNFVAMALCPKHFPKETNIAIMNYVLGDPKGVSNQITDPFYACLTISYPDQVSKKATIDQKGGWIDHQLFGGSTAKFVPILAHKKYGFDTLREEVETNSAVLVDTSFCVWYFAKKKELLNKVVEESRTYLASLGFDVRLDRLILDTLYSESLPLNTTDEGRVGLFRTHTLTASQSCQFLPILSEWKGSSKPVVSLSTRRGEVGGIDFFESDTNYNGVIVAASGSGKSFLTQRIVTDYLAEGAKVWVIDSGRSYQKLAAAVGGTFMEFSPSSDICLNPFTSFLAERGGANKSIDDEMDFLAALLERMAAQREQLTDLELETLKKGIRQTFIEYQGHTTVRNIADWLMQQDDERAQNLALRLDSFAYGQFSKNFNDHANVNMNNDFVVLELDDLKNQKQLQQVVLLQLVNQISHEMYMTKGRKKVLIIDEAWSLLDDPIMARAMETAYRTARKYSGAVITVTQGIADLYRSRNSQAMIENAAWQLILEQKAEAIDSVIEEGLLKVEPYFHHMLKTVKTVRGSYSEIYVVRSGISGIFRLTVDRFTSIMFSTTGPERDKIMEVIDQGGDVIEAIQQFMIGETSYNKFQELKQLIFEVVREGTSRRELHGMLEGAIAQVEKMEQQG